MKKTMKLAVLAITLLIALVAVGCTKEKPKAVAAPAAPAAVVAPAPKATTDLKDGFYFAIDEEFASTGWKDYVSLTVKNGRFETINWSGVNFTGDDKKVFDKAGNFNMVKYGNAQDEWYVQATRTENYLLEKQDLNAINYTDAEGSTDDIAGVSIQVNGMYALVEEALASGPQETGPYADGSYYAIKDEYDPSKYKNYVSLYVINGNIVQVYWSGVNAAGEDKQVIASEGKFGMISDSKIGKEWHEQAQASEAYLIATQDPKKITFSNAEGSTDDIAGVSMHVSDFFTLAGKALAAGPKK